MPGADRTDQPDALLIEGLRFRYPGRSDWTVAIDDLRLGAGEAMLLAGGSGRGKSTLLHLIAGLLEPDEGRIVVAGQDVHALSGAARDLFRGDRIGVIFQTFHLLNGFTARENVMAALMFSRRPRSEHRSRADDLLARLGIERPEAMPEHLSIGQQQRVAVARALASEPALVLADEPTASLDPDNAATAMDLVRDGCRDVGAALLCTSHDPRMADRFERRVALDDLVTAS